MGATMADDAGPPVTKPARRSPWRWVAWALLGLFAVTVVYVGATLAQVYSTSRQDQAKAADAIVVMGAAQYDGRPSPVLQARLDHAVELWRKGYAEMIVVTGGKKTGDRVTQGVAGYQYLRSQGVPENDIKVEVEGTNSYEELSASALIIKNAGVSNKVLIVTDPYHSFRVQQIANEVGLDASVSPADVHGSVAALARETVASSIGRLIGYRRLNNIL
jgi:uncharacterized SAM-binding protein YcdF (DUF218 family)